MPSYLPNTVDPYPGDDTSDLQSDPQGSQARLSFPRAVRPSGPAKLQDRAGRGFRKIRRISAPPRTGVVPGSPGPRASFITRQAVDKLTSHLYKPGPRHRRITSDATLDAWYNRVAQDIQLLRIDATSRPAHHPADAR